MDAVCIVKDTIVIYRNNDTILIVISSKHYFSILKNTSLKSSLTLRRHCNLGTLFEVYFCALTNIKRLLFLIL